MSERVDVAGLSVAKELHAFVENDVLPGLAIAPADFWRGFASLLDVFSPRNKALLAVRDDLQSKIDTWHQAHAGQSIDVRRAHLWVSAETADPVVQVVNRDEQHIGALGHRLAKGR